MNAKMITHNMSLTPTLAHWNLRLKPKKATFVVGVLARPTEETLSKTHVYKDNWFDKLAINHLSKSVQAATGNNCFRVKFVFFFYC